jgi:DNA-binding NtrC family response regulator
MGEKSDGSGKDVHEARGRARRNIGTGESAAMRRCRVARMLMEAGNNESARHALSIWWAFGASRPRTKGLTPLVAAEMLLLAGAITGRLGSAKQTRGAQALAEELVSESLRIFEHEGEQVKAAEAQAELAQCCWRVGDFEGARRLLRQVRISAGEGPDWLRVKQVTLLRSAIVERDSGDPTYALQLLMASEELFLSSADETLKGRYRINRGLVFLELAQETRQEHYLVRAADELKAACYHLAGSKTKRLFAHAENNLGFVLLCLGLPDEAAEHLGRAHKLFTELGDPGLAAQVRETQARHLLDLGRYEEAASLATDAASALEAGERPAVLAEALATKGVALARSGRFDEAREAFEHAVAVAEEAGAWETAGLATLSAIEELQLDFVEERKLYERAASLLAGARHYGTLLRLKKVSDKVIAATHQWDFSAMRPSRNSADGSAQEAFPLRTALLRLSGNQSPLLIVGENNEDRWLMALIAHERSGRSGRPFVVLDCSALEGERALRALLGRTARREGDCTLFFDNVQELSRSDQGRVLHLVRDGVVECGVSKRRSVRLDVRVLAGTPCDLLGEVAHGHFSPELFEQLGGRRPLATLSAEALDELRLLEGCLAKEEIRRCYQKGAKLPKAATQVLQAPAADVLGMLARHHARTPATAGPPDALCGSRAPSPEVTWAVDDGERVTLSEAVRLFKLDKIRDALERTDGSITKAAEWLGMPYQTLQNIIKADKHKEIEKARTSVKKRARRTDATTRAEESQ